MVTWLRHVLTVGVIDLNLYKLLTISLFLLFEYRFNPDLFGVVR